MKQGKNFELKEQLLIERSVLNNDGPRELTVPWLQDLFQPDNVREGISLEKIKSVGGYEGLERLLKTNLVRGIQENQADRKWRQSVYGNNQPIPEEQTTFFQMILENFQDKTIQILCAAATLSLVLGIITHGIKQGWLEGVSIILAVIIIAGVTSVNNYMKEKQFRKLNEVAKRKNVNARRNGQVVNMSAYELLVGDIVQVQTGEILSVDGIVFKSSNLEADESSITGETKQVKKEDYIPGKKNNPFVISGSSITKGTCMVLILTVGVNTQAGINEAKLKQPKQDTPLQEKLSGLADQIGIIGIYSAAFTFLALLCHFLYDSFFNGHCLICATAFDTLVGYFIIAVSIVVIAVPEGLPLAVTISLAYSVGKMKDQNNLVRYLAACETMGGANNICSDKTGTLTKNIMTVMKLWSENSLHEKFTKNKMLSKNTADMLCIGVSMNSDANPKILNTGKFEPIGNKTECALLEMAYNMGYNYTKYRSQTKVIKTFPFNSELKTMSSVCQLEGKPVLFTKGAPDFLLGKCSFFAAENGETKLIDQEFKDVVKRTISQFAEKCLRTLLICYRDLKKEDVQGELSTDKLETKLIVVGLVGIKDPLKQAVPEAVDKCKRAGIIVRMVTGDNPETATAIAREARIIPQKFQRPQEGAKGYYVIMEGKQFRQTVGGLVREQGADNKVKQRVRDIDAFKKIADELRVLARSSPEDKYLLATGLKELKNVVAMTGDGTNDAPALKKADIGFAMGQAGTEVAKKAAGIILLDDNFSSIITAVKYGRNIFDCIRKFLQFQLTVNVVAIFMAFLGAVIIKQSPLTPIQMLWVNLIMDTLAALALATEPPNESLLLRMPYSRNQQIITPQMWRNIVFHALFQMVVLSIVLFAGPQLFDVESSIGIQLSQFNEENGEHLTIFFDVFVFLQVFNFFNARKLKRQELNVFSDIGNNYLFIIIVCGIFFCQWFIVEYGGKAFKLIPLDLDVHCVCILIGSLSLLNGLFIKTCIPDGLFNSFSLFTEQYKAHSNPDQFFKGLLIDPASMRRSSKHRH